MRLRVSIFLFACSVLMRCNVDHEQVPFDHKDDSADYRIQVWEAVQQEARSPLPHFLLTQRSTALGQAIFHGT